MERILADSGLLRERIGLRMSGCPNGCSRPYLAEIALVGKAPGRYNLYLGASARGDRLGALYLENAAEPQILAALRSLLPRYAAERLPLEGFGDFTVRAGIVAPAPFCRDFQNAPAAAPAP